MTPRFTIQDIENKLKAGKIRGYEVRKVEKPKAKIVGKHFKKKHAAKDWIGRNLLLYCQQNCYTLLEEFRFSSERRYRSDWCIKELNLLFEYEGGLFRAKGAHNTASAIQRDITKHELARKLGYKVIRLTSMDYKELFNKINDVL